MKCSNTACTSKYFSFTMTVLNYTAIMFKIAVFLKLLTISIVILQEIFLSIVFAFLSKRFNKLLRSYLIVCITI